MERAGFDEKSGDAEGAGCKVMGRENKIPWRKGGSAADPG
jgi:hypothetical protein